MFKILILLIAAFVIFMILRKPGPKETEKETKDKPVTYVCTKCGKKDCDCFKEDETP